VVRGKYRVESFLATGTMANVYAATHRNGSRVALKIMHRELAEDESLRERFKREGYFANSIGHPGVIRAIDDDVTEDGCAFLVMELLDGETLEERRRSSGGKLPLSFVLGVADSLLDVLAAAHAREVVHRDLKPDNVFLTTSGEVKILDFGVARWNDGKDSSDMTGIGMVLGTPAYMPPEQALGRREDVDAQSDIWAVGATLFVVLSGEPVHEGGDAKAKLIATARTAARPLQDAAPEVPRSVAAVIDRALRYDKRERWPDANAMREALRWARMSLEGAEPSVGIADVSGDAIPAPVPTRRNLEEETAVARYPSEEVITSAPPITLREAPRQPGGEPSVGPVFSLRRSADEEELSPSTERVPGKEELKPAVRTLPGISPSQPPPAEGTAEAAAALAFGMTQPMAAMALPDMHAPRPAAGMPPAHLPSAPPPAYPSAPPAAFPSAPPYAPTPPLGSYASSPPVYEGSAAATTQSRRVSLTPEAPGPMLAQVVEKRPTIWRILVPVLIALALIAGIVAMVKRRQAAVNAAAAAAAAASASAASAGVAPPPPLPPTPVASGAAATPPGASSVKVDDATLAGAGVVPSGEPSVAPTTSASAQAHAKRPPRARPPRVKRPTSSPATASSAADPSSEPLPTFPVPSSVGPAGSPPPAPPEPSAPAPAPAPEAQ